MIKEISGRGLIEKKAETLKEQVIKAQTIMIQIVDKFKQLHGNASPLLSPGLPDGVWEDTTDESYRSILKHFKVKTTQPNIVAAITQLKII